MQRDLEVIRVLSVNLVLWVRQDLKDQQEILGHQLHKVNRV